MLELCSFFDFLLSARGLKCSERSPGSLHFLSFFVLTCVLPLWQRRDLVVCVPKRGTKLLLSILKHLYNYSVPRGMLLDRVYFCFFFFLRYFSGRNKMFFHSYFLFISWLRLSYLPARKNDEGILRMRSNIRGTATWVSHTKYTAIGSLQSDGLD